jgi:rhomboid protease GluP
MRENATLTRQQKAASQPKVEELPYPSCQVPTRVTRLPAADSPGPQPRKWRPNITWTILILNVLVWVVDALLSLACMQIAGEPHYYPLLEWGAKSNALILQGQVWRLVTPIFIHVGIIHLAFNTYALYMIAPQIECFYGPLRFLSIYMLSGIYGVLFSFALSPAPSAGASGAILGLIGTQAAFFYRYRNAFGERGRRQFYGTVAVIAINMVLTFSASGIDIWGHLGGLFIGAVLGWTLMPRYALVGTEPERSLVDLNNSRRWGIAVGGAILVLVLSAWLTIATQNTSI